MTTSVEINDNLNILVDRMQALNQLLEEFSTKFHGPSNMGPVKKVDVPSSTDFSHNVLQKTMILIDGLSVAQDVVRELCRFFEDGSKGQTNITGGYTPGGYTP